MKEEYWQLLAKYLAHETNEEDDRIVQELMETNKVFQKAYLTIETLWNKMDVKPQTFDKERIIALMEENINRNNRFINASTFRKLLKYAAIFVGVIAIYFLISDLSKTKIITADNSIISNYQLPDGSEITINKGGEIEYSASKILGFNREVSIINGEAFFEIAKRNGKQFTVHTPDYDVKVTGTKFNININKNSTSTVLSEGSVIINMQSVASEINMIPGNKIVCRHGSNKMPGLQKVNPAIFTLWTKSKLEFNDYSMNDMKEIFRIYFNKDLIFNDKYVKNIKLGGSAPIDDLGLILKGLSTVLKREVIERNDTIIINDKENNN